jgi:cytochrome c oxidase subunit 2
MSMQVVVETPEGFETWLAGQKAAAPPEIMQGLATFATPGCIACHTPMVNDGTTRGMLGPNLRTVATRRMIAAGLLPNTPANLRSWLKSPQHVKPNALMNIIAPQCTAEGEPDPCCRSAGIGNCLTDETIEQLVAYLQILK